MNKLFLISIALMLTACQQSNATKTELVAETSGKAKTAVESNVEKNTVAVKTGSSELGFTYKTSSERAQIGVPYKIMLEFSGAADSLLSTEFSTSTGLSMVSEAAASIQMNKSGKADTQTITVIPQSEGIHYVNIYQPGAEQKPSVIRVIAGDKDIKEYLQSPGNIVEQEDGSKVISMKADEG